MTPREPDRFDKQAREAEVHCPHLDMGACVPCLAAALRAEHASALERAARGCESMVIGGRAWTKEQAIAAEALFAAAKEIRALIPPAAAHAAEVTPTAAELATYTETATGAGSKFASIMESAPAAETGRP